MPLTMTYTDKYLAAKISQDNEDQAVTDVDDAMGDGDFGDYHDKLVVLRAYILCCLDHTTSPTDAFSTKATLYRKEYDQLLAVARAYSASVDETGTITPVGLFTIPLYRS